MCGYPLAFALDIQVSGSFRDSGIDGKFGQSSIMSDGLDHAKGS